MLSLDDPKIIKKYDHFDMEGILNSFPGQCSDALRLGSSYRINKSLQKSYKNIVCAGLGGSAIGADIARSYIADELKVPFFVNRNETLPAFIDKNTLFIALSYSGNTEDIIKAYNYARFRHSSIIVITSGGKLKARAIKDGISVITIPPLLPPRTAIGWSFFPLLMVLSRLGFISDKTRAAEEAIDVMESLRDNIIGTCVGVKKNMAKYLAKKLYGKVPVIYSGQDHMDAVAIRWKSQIAENAKAISFVNVFPEMAHNEIVGWDNPKEVLKRMSVIILKDSGDNRTVSKLMDIAEQIITDQKINVFRVKACGKSLLARIFSLIYIGDFVSFYLAILNKCDPTLIERIDKLKREVCKR